MLSGDYLLGNILVLSNGSFPEISCGVISRRGVQMT